MDVLVLDTIHGGREIASEMRAAGDHVDEVDVYRGAEGVSVETARTRSYDLIVAPVHLDPSHPLLGRTAPVCTHHEAVARLIGRDAPHPMIEVTGARGKTTTAHAIASLMPGTGILHTSAGTWRYPTHELLWKKSITPASVIPAARQAYADRGWCVAEVSLGVTGAGDVGVLTSAADYPIAAGKRRALAEKCASLGRAGTVVVPPGISLEAGSVISMDEIVSTEGCVCRYDWNGVSGSYTCLLLGLEGYRQPLMLATAVACVLGIDPSPLAEFRALEGRMSTSRDGGVLIVDNANSGACVETTCAAAHYARDLSGEDEITLVIGAESRTICEGFPVDEVASAISAVSPSRVVFVGEYDEYEKLTASLGPEAVPMAYARTLDEAREVVRAQPAAGNIVLSVKSWR